MSISMERFNDIERRLDSLMERVSRYELYVPVTSDYQDLPFETAWNHELLEGQLCVNRLRVNSRTPYGPHFYTNYMAGWIMRNARKAHKMYCKHLDLNRLPTELLFEILEYMHPIDLYHLAQSTKTFRSILLKQKALWTNAFRAHSDLPSCPKDISEPQWSSLLFGPGTCDICGNRGALPDFAFRKRLCDLCMDIHTVSFRSGTILNTIPNDPEHKLYVVWSLVPKTLRTRGTQYVIGGLYAGSPRYLEKDIYAMVDKVKGFLADIEAEVTGAVEKYQIFLSETSAKRDQNAYYAKRANQWALTIDHILEAERGRLQEGLATRCMTRFANSGHDPRDTTLARDDVLVLFRNRGITRLTPKAYRKIKPTIEAIVHAEKKLRLVQERRDLVEASYTEYRKTLKPEQWAYLAPLDEVYKDTLFEDFISSQADVLGELSQDDATVRYRRIISDFEDFHMRRLALLLAEETDQMSSSMDPASCLNLATTVFTCRTHATRPDMVYCSWSNIFSHICNSGDPHSHADWLDFNQLGSDVASSLVRCLGLNPGTTTQEQLDLIDARFFCGSCPISSMRGVRGRMAYTWSECVAHAIIMSSENLMDAMAGGTPVHPSPPKWLLLTPEATQFVKEHEPAYPIASKSIWGCNLCSEHFLAGVSLKCAKAHVMAEHAIVWPVTGRDVIAYKHQFAKKSRAYSPRKPFHYGLEPPCQFICKMCPRRPIYQLWSMPDLVLHLSKTHHVDVPKQHDHWEEVGIIATSSTEVDLGS